LIRQLIKEQKISRFYFFDIFINSDTVMIKVLKGLICLMILSCSIGKREVYYNEMSKQPTVTIKENMIIVHTDNSLKNSALLIYRIDYSIDSSKKIIGLKGFQAVNKDYKTSFEISLKGFTKAQLDNYDYFWIDPDNKETKLEKIK
jgi:hypothetical protein